MPLPWLIGLGAVALGTAVVAALSDDDKPSNNSNNDDEERRRRAAERERKERERNEKKATIKQEFDQQLKQGYHMMKTALPSFVMIQGVEQCCLTLTNNGSNLGDLESNLPKELDSALEKDIALFEAIYKVNLQQTSSMINITKDIDLLNKELDALAKSIKSLS